MLQVCAIINVHLRINGCFVASTFRKSRWEEVEVCKRGQDQALGSISALEGVIIFHPGVTGAKTVIWKEGS